MKTKFDSLNLVELLAKRRCNIWHQSTTMILTVLLATAGKSTKPTTAATPNEKKPTVPATVPTMNLSEIVPIEAAAASSN